MGGLDDVGAPLGIVRYLHDIVEHFGRRPLDDDCGRLVHDPFQYESLNQDARAKRHSHPKRHIGAADKMAP